MLYRLFVILTLLTWAEPLWANRQWSSGFELNSISHEVDGGSVGAASVTTTPVRTGWYALRVNPVVSVGYIVKRSLPMVPGQTYHYRFPLYVVSGPDADTLIFSPRRLGLPRDPALVLTPGLSLRMIDIYGNQVGSASPPLTTGVFYVIELEAVYDTGLCAARLDGLEFATGQCAAIEADLFRLGAGVNGVAVTADLVFDDIGLNDASGTVQNSWLGAGSIVHRYPDGEGDADVHVARGGVDRGSNVGQLDESPTPNDATDYLVLTRADSLVDVDLQDSGAINGSITFVAVGGRITGATASSTNWKPRIKSQAGGTTVAGVNSVIASTAWGTHDDNPLLWNFKLTQHVDPQDGISPWSNAALDSMQIGVMTTDGNPDLLVTSVWALIEFVP